MNPNANQVFASLFVDQLAELGVKYAVICAGSRSTPLTSAFSLHNAFQCYSQVDERSAGFFALGISQATGDPVVLISTSGTAAANFYPAIIEANASSHPLLILTADRPHELRISGANQTTDQLKLFGDHVNWFVDVALPEKDPSDRLLRYMRQVAAMAFEKSLYPTRGPIHLNFPFRKPLEPSKDQDPILSPHQIVDEFQSQPTISVSIGAISPSHDQISHFQDLVDSNPFLIVICGPNTAREVSPDIIKEFVDKTDGLILADPLSGIRYSDLEQDSLITAYENFLQGIHNLPEPDLVIQVGDMPISKYLGKWMEEGSFHWMVLTGKSKNRDGVLGSNTWIKCNPELLLSNYESDSREPTRDDMEAWKLMEAETRDFITGKLDDFPMFEPSLIRKVLNYLNPSQIFVANSLMPRHLDQYIFQADTQIDVFSNRGVSGIDGTLSTALGIAISTDKPTVLLTGDLAFYHDLNGLLAMSRYKIPLKIIIINNQGGAIFDRLPIRDYNPPFDEYFLTRHELNFDKIAEQYQIDYKSISEPDELQDLENILNSSDQLIIEFVVPTSDVERIRKEIHHQYMSRSDN